VLVDCQNRYHILKKVCIESQLELLGYEPFLQDTAVTYVRNRPSSSNFKLLISQSKPTVHTTAALTTALLRYMPT